MKILFIVILMSFQASANQASDLAVVTRCFDKSQRLSSKLNHRRPATVNQIKSYRRKNNHCVRLSIRYENRYEHLKILDEIEEVMTVSR